MGANFFAEIIFNALSKSVSEQDNEDLIARNSWLRNCSKWFLIISNARSSFCDSCIIRYSCKFLQPTPSGLNVLTNVNTVSTSSTLESVLSAIKSNSESKKPLLSTFNIISLAIFFDIVSISDWSTWLISLSITFLSSGRFDKNKS